MYDYDYNNHKYVYCRYIERYHYVSCFTNPTNNRRGLILGL